MAKQTFQTEVSQLLHLIIHSLYSHKEIFIRELVSNASDAIDKLKLLSLTESKYKDLSSDYQIDIYFSNGDNPSITFCDTGIGMSKKDLKDNLGTIARSGTKKFVSNLSGDKVKDSNLIGQFGVGFYSSFMVADKVEVISKKAGMKNANGWVSDGKSGYEIFEADRDSFGTTIKVNLNSDGTEFANKWQIENIIKKYSNHIPYPIYLHYEEKNGEGDNEKIETKIDQVNAASAFWKKPKSSIKKKEYNEFYSSFTSDTEEPMLHMHTQAEGTLDYTTLFYIPSKAPFDLFNSEYKAGVKLYVKRVFITDDNKELMPPYLRFVKGVIDSEDIPLNVSREMLQHNQILSKIRSNATKKILEEIQKLSKDHELYAKFFNEFGKPIKEGLYQDYPNRDLLLELVRYKSTMIEGYTSLNDYKERMKDEQKNIYYITGANKEALGNSPLLEMYNKNGVEVLILDDDIDEIVISAIPTYKEISLKSVNHSDAVDEIKDKEIDSNHDELKPLVKKIKDHLGEQVKDVFISSRLTDSPACIVADQNDPTSQMQNIMRAMGQSGDMPDIKPILEINPNHKIIKKMKLMRKGKALENLTQILFDQSLLREGIALNKPSDFVGRLNQILEKTL